MAVRCYDDTTVCSVQRQCTVVLSGRFGTLDPELSHYPDLSFFSKRKSKLHLNYIETPVTCVKEIQTEAFVKKDNNEKEIELFL